MKNILCFGDSNTWGFVPGSIDMETFYMERYSREQRWPGRLQQLLGPDYHIAEAGMNGRTTNVDSELAPGTNGKTFLPIALYSQAPLDLVVIMLGTNDLKVEFMRSPEDIANGAAELIEIIQESKIGADMQSSPEILLVCPPEPVDDQSFDGQFIGAMDRYKNMEQAYEAVAKKYNVHYYNANQDIDMTDIDGIHFDEAAHKKFAGIIADKVNRIL